MLLLEEKIPTFQVKELELMYKVILAIFQILFVFSNLNVFQIFESQLEPACIAPLIIKRAQELYEHTPTAVLLPCTVMYSLPEKRQKLTKIAEGFVTSKNCADYKSAMPILFKVGGYGV